MAYRAWVEPRLGDKLVPPIDEFSTDEFDIDPSRVISRGLFNAWIAHA